MILFLLRWIITSAIFHLGLLYAAFGTLYTAEETSRAQNKNISFPLHSLQLWLILFFFLFLSYTVVEQFPFFLEARAVFTWLLITAPSTSHSRLYNIVFDPLLGRLLRVFTVLENNQRIAQKVGVTAVRLCVELAISIMNYVARTGAIEEESLHDIITGLMLSRHALQNSVAARVNGETSSAASTPPPSPTHALLR
ncbi:hypothetical protein LSM04_003970 [Trypanosoma melophagium]|uniref:uncharacterized protein n=1 Tax=Trypanosoma melophagium TaxID=715481 RepID=UPI00351A8BCF|nr:hypothetical protein LSM04_003970 [Trypanosoma melophagium]